MLIDTIIFVGILILIYYGCLFTWYALTLLLAFPEVLKVSQESYHDRITKLMQHSLPPVTIISAIYNEEKRVLTCIDSFLNSNYKNLKMIICNDGSTDKTMEILKDELSLVELPPSFRQMVPTSKINAYYQSKTYPNIMVIDKEHHPANNAADAHNASLNTVNTPLVMTLDADTLLEEDAISLIVYDFLASEHCIAVGGSLYVLNGNQVQRGKVVSQSIPKNFVAALQCSEYFRSFSYGRAGLNQMSGALCYPGAFTLFETEALREFGGFDKENFSFDAEVIFRLHHQMRKLRYPTSVRFSISAHAWTTVPESLKSYWVQRNHWQRGMLLSAAEHIEMCFNPRYGIVGLVTFPCYVVFEIGGPVVEFCAYILLILILSLHIVTWTTVGWFYCLAWGGLIILTTGVFYLNMLTGHRFYRFKDLIYCLILTTLEWFGFRQFKAACCFFATIQFFFSRIRRLFSRKH